MNDPDLNPYAAPKAKLDGVTPASADMSHAVAIREAHVGHEASLKSLGCLFYFGAIVLGFAFVGLGLGATQGELTFGPIPLLIGGAFFFVYLAAGAGLRRLEPWARLPAGLICALGLIQIPIGTIFSLYFLYLLFSAKGATCFSPDYKRVIAATPEVRHKSSPLAVGILILLVVVFVAALVVASQS